MIGQHSSNNQDQWYSPTSLMEPVRSSLGGIELDPASCIKANTIVNADRIYTAEDDGLEQPWIASTLFLNPPFSRGSGNLFPRFAEKFVSEFEAGSYKSGVFLSNSSQETKVHQLLMDKATLVAFPNKRTAFINGETMEAAGSNNKPQVLYLLSDDRDTISRFYAEFNAIGSVLFTLKALQIAKGK